MHQSTTTSLSQTFRPRWASTQFLSLSIVQILFPVTFGYSLSSEAVVMRELRRWKRLWRRSLKHTHKRISIGPSRSCWNGTSGLQPEEFHVFTIYISIKIEIHAHKSLDQYMHTSISSSSSNRTDKVEFPDTLSFSLSPSLSLSLSLSLSFSLSAICFGRSPRQDPLPAQSELMCRIPFENLTFVYILTSPAVLDVYYSSSFDGFLRKKEREREREIERERERNRETERERERERYWKLHTTIKSIIHYWYFLDGF